MGNQNQNLHGSRCWEPAAQPLGPRPVLVTPISRISKGDSGPEETPASVWRQLLLSHIGSNVALGIWAGVCVCVCADWQITSQRRTLYPPHQQQQRALAWKPLASHARETGMQMLIAALFARANSKLKITQEFLK